MADENDVGATGQDAFRAELAAKFAGVAEDATATEETPTAPKAVAANDQADDVVTEDDSDGSGQPSPAKEDDPWAELKSKFTPQQLREKLELAEKAAEVEANAKEMRRQASIRGEQTGRERSEMAELSRKVEEQLARNAGLVDMAAQVADENPEFAQQLLRVVGGKIPANDGTAANGRAPLRGGSVDPEVLRMREELNALKQQSNQVAFGISHAKVQELAMEVATKHPLLQRSHVQKLGIPEKVIRGAIAAVYEKDRSEGGSINPWDSVALRAAVTAAVAAEIKPYEDFGREEVTAWRAARKAINAQAPPSSKGATAGVRSAQNFSEPPPRGGSPEDFQKHLANKFMRASQPVRPAE